MKPPNTSVCPDRTLNSVEAFLILSAGPPGTVIVVSTELTSISMRERIAALRSACGVMFNETPYFLNVVVDFPSLSTEA